MNLAFVLLAEPILPKDPDVVAAFASYACGSQRLRPAPGEAGKPDVRAFELSPGGTVMVALMPAPVPNGEAEGYVGNSVSSMGTGWNLPPHEAHLAVVMMTPAGAEAGRPTSPDELSAFTSMLAAVSKASGAVGIYWGSAGATHNPRFFEDVAGEKESGSRLMLWTGLSLGQQPDGRLGLLSLGMGQLGLPNLWLVARRPDGNDALGFFFDLLGYVVSGGQPLPEGDTVGRSDRERLPVHYVSSPIDPDARVWRVELP